MLKTNSKNIFFLFNQLKLIEYFYLILDFKSLMFSLAKQYNIIKLINILYFIKM